MEATVGAPDLGSSKTVVVPERTALAGARTWGAMRGAPVRLSGTVWTTGKAVSCLCRRSEPLSERMDPRMEPRRPGVCVEEKGRSGGDDSESVVAEGVAAAGCLRSFSRVREGCVSIASVAMVLLGHREGF